MFRCVWIKFEDCHTKICLQEKLKVYVLMFKFHYMKIMGTTALKLHIFLLIFSVAVELMPLYNDFKLLFGPYEFVIDTPFDAGCFELLTDLDDSKKISEDVDTLTPGWCITKCLGTDPKNRFALLTKGTDCYCYETVPYKQLQAVNDQNETLVCSSYCKGGQNYLCGAENAVNIYVGSKKINSNKGRASHNSVLKCAG